MAYQALYRKYRPKTFSEVVGQEHITEALKNELAAGKAVHAYLFTGTRGTGKTSSAKILAKAVNCLNPQNGDPCLECESCKAIANGENTDIVEIDAASNNSVDSIRELRERVSFAPSASKYRVYIIDEVHMLTVSAFNALLKTLEEPPEHVIFILATTEVHKLPATILSRCQRFDFRRIEADKICERIHRIAEIEGFTVTDGAASLIAATADGGMRDALSMLDLCTSGGGTVDEATVESVLGMAGEDYLLQLADCINRHDAEAALLLTDKLYNASVDMQRLISELTSHFRDLMIIKAVKSEQKPIVCSKARLEALTEQAERFDIKEIMHAVSLLQSTNAAMQTGNRRCEAETALIRLCTPSLAVDVSSLERRISALESRAFAGTPAAVKPQSPAPAEPEPPEDEYPEPPEPVNEAPATETPIDEEWAEIRRMLKTSCPLIAGVLNESHAYIRGGYLLIAAPNENFRSMVNNPTYRDAIRKAAMAVLGKAYKLGPYTAAEKTATADPLAELAAKLKNFEIN